MNDLYDYSTLRLSVIKRMVRDSEKDSPNLSRRWVINSAIEFRRHLKRMSDCNETIEDWASNESNT